jgi:hypothetical protein
MSLRAEPTQCALDRLFQHAHVDPFIGKPLIPRQVTSGPNRGSTARAPAAFDRLEAADPPQRHAARR